MTKVTEIQLEDYPWHTPLAPDSCFNSKKCMVPISSRCMLTIMQSNSQINHQLKVCLELDTRDGPDGQLIRRLQMKVLRGHSKYVQIHSNIICTCVQACDGRSPKVEVSMAPTVYDQQHSWRILLQVSARWHDSLVPKIKYKLFQCDTHVTAIDVTTVGSILWNKTMRIVKQYCVATSNFSTNLLESRGNQKAPTQICLS